MENALLTFLTKQNIDMHKEHLKNLRLKYSILEKSIPELKGAGFFDIPRLRIKSADKHEVLSLRLDILYHEVFFNSFTDRPTPCHAVRERYGSEESFAYELYKIARTLGSVFLLISLDARGNPVVTHTESQRPVIPKNKPLLAIDLFEHASFLDYGFDRDRYIELATSRLDLSKLTEYSKRH